MKRIIAIILMAILLLALAGCNVIKDISEGKLPSDIEGLLSQAGDLVGENISNTSTDESVELSVNSDGGIIVSDSDGTIGQLGGQWPENEFTALIPKPNFGISATATNEKEFSAVFTGATVQQIKDYAQEVIKAGFTVNADTEDTTALGISVYTYTAENGNGYRVEVSYALGGGGITVEKL